MEKFNAPWLYIKEQGIIYDADGREVCDIMPTGEQWEEDNAALIECAPEMYEMLALLLDEYAISDRDHDYTEEVEQLLAKARGEHDTNS